MGRGALYAANLLTLSRLPLAALVWLAPTSLGWVLGLMALAAGTDLLDGYVARKGGVAGPHSAGAWLDPLCDKAFIFSVAVAVYVAYRPEWIILSLILTRELIQVPLVMLYLLLPGLRHRLRYDFRAAVAGKLTTVGQFLAVGAILLRSPAQLPLAAATAFLGMWAAIYYVHRAERRLRRDGP